MYVLKMLTCKYIYVQNFYIKRIKYIYISN